MPPAPAPPAAAAKGLLAVPAAAANGLGLAAAAKGLGVDAAAAPKGEEGEREGGRKGEAEGWEAAKAAKPPDVRGHANGRENQSKSGSCTLKHHDTRQEM